MKRIWSRSWSRGDSGMDGGLIAFGLFALLVGVGTGYFMCTRPEGLNPHWPLGMALLAPALFVLAGLHLLATGFDRPHLSHVMIRAMLICFGLILNWAAFFTKGFQCRATISFLGVALTSWQPSELECRYSLRFFVAIIDALVFTVIGAFLWQRHRAQSTPRQRPQAGA